ncbi:MAG: T9SS type A sorting domain-containing protein, partial [Bacteroidetes bacterium]|nr:T9SS type A sorting domain-containing protein [Bacteroidota bacterium]
PQTQQYLITSFGDGLTIWDGNSGTSSRDIEDVNYPFNTDKIAAAHYEEGMWISAFEESIYFQSEAGDWVPKSFGLIGDDEILEITSDNDGQLWFRVDPQGSGGIIVYSPSLNTSVRLDNSVDKGGLPTRAVNDIEVDVEGNVWVGTDEGVAYFPRGIFLFEGPVNAIKPILDGRFLLSNEEVSSIESDGGNRKWMGTENGAWLFNEFGDELLEHFTIENSPLLSNQIIDIEIHDQTGELFISTNLGLVSYRTGSTKGSPVHETKIKIFPNPVTPDFSGIVGMEGLAYNSEIKITDVSGNLVWQTTSNGGSATWNLQTLQGGRPPSGIYLIFSSLPDGSDSLVGKIAIID